jgi:hypothetical protein
MGYYCGLGICLEAGRAADTKTSYLAGCTAVSLLFVCPGFAASCGAVIRFFAFLGF